MSDRPLPQENLFLGSVMDQGATPDVVSALVKSLYCLPRSVHPHCRVRLFFAQGRCQYLDTPHRWSRNARFCDIWVDAFSQRMPED